MVFLQDEVLKKVKEIGLASHPGIVSAEGTRGVASVQGVSGFTYSHFTNEQMIGIGRDVTPRVPDVCMVLFLIFPFYK
jgi:hypothetical protein